MTAKKTPETDKSNVCRAVRTEAGVRMDITIFKSVRSRKGGRAALVLTPEGADYIAKLASLGCTQEEIADSIGVSVTMMHNSNNSELCEDALKRGRTHFLTSIRTAQSKIMKGGNSSMAIFLGKNYLGQHDTVEQTVSVKNESKADSLTYEQVLTILDKRPKKE